MRTLLEHLVKVLTSDSGLTALVDPSNVAVTVRNPTAWPAVEIGLTDQARDPKGHQTVTVELLIHSSQSAADCWKIADAIHRLMTAKQLTPSSGFSVARCHQVDAHRFPRLDTLATVALEYALHVVEHEPVHQAQ